MSDIYINDKVSDQYEVFIGVKAEEHDMRAVASELISLGYTKLIDFEHNGNVILIYTKKV